MSSYGPYSSIRRDLSQPRTDYDRNPESLHCSVKNKETT